MRIVVCVVVVTSIRYPSNIIPLSLAPIVVVTSIVVQWIWDGMVVFKLFYAVERESRNPCENSSMLMSARFRIVCHRISRVYISFRGTNFLSRLAEKFAPLSQF